MKQILSIVFSCFVFVGFAQDTRTLFKVDDTKVTVDEFKRIYEKTNGEEANYSRASVQEYLDLYVNFKLKVKEAHAMGLHKDAELMRELDGYRNQLANSYLIDKEIKDKLVKEVYKRQESDREIRHILFPTNKRSTPSDTLKALQRAMGVLGSAKSGADFADLAKKHSGDRGSVNNGGYLGFVSSMLPDGFYEVENAIYNNPVGSVVGPVRSAAGYHIIKIESERPARGAMEIAHLLVMKNDNDALAKKRIDSIYALLANGRNFSVLCAELSDDAKTKKKGGYIGEIRIGQYEESFENAAFNLAKDEAYSKPVETSVGYHIIQRISKKERSAIDKEYRLIESKVVRDSRFDLAEKALIKKVRNKAVIKIDKDVFNAWATSKLDSTLLTYRWSAPKERPETAFVDFDNGTASYTIKDFIVYLMRSAKKRVDLGMNKSYLETANLLIDDFVDEMCLKYEETMLESKYPDFAQLMQEYREGILLFEATKSNVWDKASDDTEGVQKFYDKNKTEYQWNERAKLLKYNVYSGDPQKAKAMAESARNENIKQMEMRYNRDNKNAFSMTEIILEKEKMSDYKGLMWKDQYVTEPERDSRNTFVFYKIDQILPAGQKSLDESRGYVVADYQEVLEKEWIGTLKSKYKVKIDDKVLKSIIK